MTLPSIGSFAPVGATGRMATVVDTRTIAELRDGKSLVSVRYKAEAPARATPVGPRGDSLTASESAAVEQLRQRDSQVRQEEKAHAAAAGSLGGPISYIFQRGPDGRLYAVGGSVPVHYQTRSGDPQELERIGAKLAAAALAPINPSAADLALAREAYRLGAESGRVEPRRGAPDGGLDLSA